MVGKGGEGKEKGGGEEGKGRRGGEGEEGMPPTATPGSALVSVR